MSFRIQREQLDEHTIVLRPEGAITGTSDLSPLVDARSPRVIWDLALVSRIDSLGVREWIRMLSRLPPDQQLVWEHVSPALCSQVGMISNFVGPGRIASFITPRWCDACRTEHQVVIDAPAQRPLGSRLPGSACPSCGAPTVLDELDETYVEALLEHAL